MSPYFESPVTIDNVPRRLHVTRFTREQAIVWRAQFFQVQQRVARREGLKKSAATDAEFDVQLEGEIEDRKKVNGFYADSLTAHVTVAPDEDLRDADGVPVHTGTDLIRAYGHRTQVLADIVSAIYLENFLGPIEKKAWQARRDSVPGSDSKTLGVNGDGPAQTAASAPPSATSESAAATPPDTGGASVH